MKAKVTGLAQRVQQVMREINKENEELEKSKTRIGEHYNLQQSNLAKAYDGAIKTLMDKRKQLSEMLKHSLSDQKTFMTKQKSATCQKIEQALTACEHLSRFADTIDGASYEEYYNLLESLTKETSELESFANTLPRVEVTYLQFHENISITDKSELRPDKFAAEAKSGTRTHSSSRKHHKHGGEDKTKKGCENGIGLKNLRDVAKENVKDPDIDGVLAGDEGTGKGKERRAGGKKGAGHNEKDGI